jgi:hypothetical protein
MLLFTASLVETAHFCGLDGDGTRLHSGLTTSHSTASRVCEICATAHQTLTPTTTAFAPVMTATADVALVPVQLRSRLRFFTTYVRPPPIYSL